jgi:DNA-binding transcriptional LysR family regulator
MLLGQLEAVVAVARHGTVSNAAASLYLTQPALTARLQRLERELAAQLFVRTPRAMKLTEAGEAFLPYAARALETIKEGRWRVAAVEGGGAGRLAVGAAPAVSTYVLPRLLKQFAVAHPLVSVSVRTGHSEEIRDLVLEEQVDVGVCRTLRHPLIEATTLYEDRLVLVVEPEHRFAEAGRVAVEEVAAEQLIQSDRTSSYHELTSAFFRNAGVTPYAVMELDNIDAAKKMVLAGFGVALLPATAVADELASGALRQVEVADAEPPRQEIVGIRRRDVPAVGSVGAFLTTATAMSAELGARRDSRGRAPRPRAARRAPSRARGRARRR